MAQLKVVPNDSAEREAAVQMLEEALAEARDPASDVTGAAVFLYRSRAGTFSAWWSATRSVNEKVGAMTRAIHQLIEGANNP